MRANSTPFPAGQLGPRSTYSLAELLLGTGLLLAAFVAALVAVAHPVTTAGAVVLTGGLTMGVRTVRRRRQARRRDGQSRTVCVPHTGVCVEA